MQQQVIEGFRLSPQQEQLWKLREGRSAGLAQCALVLAGPLREDALERALATVVARHEILRTRFESLPGMAVPIQVIAEAPAPPLRRVDPGAGAEVPLPEVVAALLSWERSVPVTLDRAPAVRFALAALAPDRHLLAVTVPALCADSRSLDNLAAEIARGYQDALDGRGEPDTDEDAEPLQYVQFSEWQNEILEEDEARQAEDFWRGQELDGPGARFPLGEEPAAPAGLERFPVAIGRAAVELPAGVAARLEAAAREQGATAEAFLLTAWAALLARLAGTAELAVDVLFDGRKVEDLAGALGPFARTIPLGLRGLDGRPFARALARAAALLEEVRQRQELYGSRAPGSSPAAFAFEDALGTAEGWEAGGVRFSFADRLCCTGEHALALWARRDGGGLRLEIQFDPAAYAPGGARRLAGRLSRLLQHAVEQPATALDALDWLGDEERRQLEAWAERSAGLPAPLALPLAFAAQVARTPDALAVAAGEVALSYAELDRRADRLADHLRALGLGLESRVALFVDRAAEAIVGLLAVLKAGGAYVPVDPGQTGARLAWILADAAVDAVLTRQALAASLPEVRVPVVAVDADLPEGGAAAGPAPGLDPRGAAYVLYTSGSTGRPKGATIEHRSVACLGEALAEQVYAAFEGERPLRVAVNAPLAFDASVKQVIQLLRGHSLWLVPEELRGDGRALLDWLRAHEIDVVDCTPSHLRLLLDAGLADAGSPFPRAVLVGGEAISPALWEALAADRGRVYFNVYGPTECTVDAAVCRVTPGTAPALGLSLPTVPAQVLDERLRLVPLGVPGELCLGGPQLSRGYLGRPGLTAEKFVPDPFGAAPGGRLYRTGDRVRRLADGRLEFLGRLDRQVKLRGIRLEPGEVEAALRESPQVREAFVALREDQPGDQRLVAYLLPRRGPAPAAGAGRRERHELPNGLAVYEQNRNETDYLYEEIFAKRCYLQHGVRLPQDACVLDVGANIGMFTLQVHQECARPRVYSFEPVPAIFDVLRANVELYGPGTKLFPFGLSAEEREEAFTYYPRYSMMSSQSRHSRPESEVEVVKRFLENLREEGDADAGTLLGEANELLAGRFEGQEVTARLRRLSDVLREEGIDRVDLLKVDVQRAEIEVLSGIDDEDWRRIDQVVMEVHDAPGTDSEGRVGEVLALLERHGFQAVAEQDELLRGTDRYNLYAVARHRESRGAEAPAAEGTGDAEAVPADLRQFLRRRLPEALVPAAFVWLDELPLTRNGKVDVAALPAPEEVAPAREVAPPRTPFEEVLAGIWAEVLGHERVGIDESFFDLGGHSLLATQLMSRVRAAFEVDVPLRALFEAPTVAGLAARVEAAVRAGEGIEAPPVVPVPRHEGAELPLSFAQHRFWFLQQLEPETAAYNSSKAVLLEGELHVPALAATLGEVVRRHEVLRTTFRVVGGQPWQHIAPPQALVLPVIDLEALPEPAREAESQCLLAAEGRRVFDLAAGPLLRAALLRLGPGRHVVLLTLHHIVADAWSLGILVREVAALYRAFSAGRPSPLPELAVQYADFASWQRRWLAGEILERELGYWRRQLGTEPPPLDLPTDRPRSAAAGTRGGRETFQLPADLSAALTGFSREEGATLFMTLLAGFQALLARYSGQDQIAVGVPNAGRGRRETEDLIGCFLNMLVLKADLAGGVSFRELVQRVRRVALEAYTHQDLPFEKLVEELQPERSAHRTPLFQVAFGLQNAPREELDLPGLRLRPLGTALESARYELTLWLYEGHETLGVGWTYNAGLFERDTIVRMHRHLETLLREAMARPDDPLDDLAVLSAEERADLERRKRALKDANRQRFLAARPRPAAGMGEAR